MTMHRKHTRNLWAQVLLSVVFVLATAGYGIAQAAPAGEPEHRVVIQISTADSQVQSMALHNAANLQAAFGRNNVKIEIVAYGPGLKLLTAESRYPERVTRMASHGIRFSACHNTMEAIKRKTGHSPELLDGIQVVPSGVARIARLQEKGYAYIRP